MKNFKFSILSLALFALAFVSCENDTSVDESTITFLPKLTMMGDQNVELSCDATVFNDPGLIAEEQGQPVNVDVAVEGKYFGSSAVDQPDDYNISYSAVNKDGIPGAAIRTVLWPVCNGDLVNSIEGMYSADVVRNGTVDPTYQGLQYIMIRDMGNNVYQLSDAIGGYYDFGRGYGFHYAGTGMQVTANDISANDFTHDGTIGVGDFGGDLTMSAFSVDAGSKTITFTTNWSFGFDFEVTLTQVEL